MRANLFVLPVVAILLAAVPLLPAPAAAQDVSKEKLEKFEQHVATGAEQFKAGEYQAALEEFRAARQIVDHPKLSYKIGRTLQELGRCAEAQRAYERYLSYDKLSESDRQRGKSRLEELGECRPLGELELECTPSESTVSIEERSLECPVSIDLEAGTYEVEVSAPGFASRELTVEVKPEATTRRAVKLIGSGESAEQVDSGGVDWVNVAKWSGIGVGGGLVLGGLAYDLSAISRNDEIADAREENNTERLRRLEDEARAAKTRTIVLYATGAALVAGGVTLLVLDQPQSTSKASNSPDRSDGPKAGLRVGLGHLGAFVRW